MVGKEGGVRLIVVDEGWWTGGNVVGPPMVCRDITLEMRRGGSRNETWWVGVIVGFSGKWRECSVQATREERREEGRR